MPLERAENKVQLNLGVQFLRLGTWDDSSAVKNRLDVCRQTCHDIMILF